MTAKDGRHCGIVISADQAETLATAALGLQNNADHYAEWAACTRYLAAAFSFKTTLNAYRYLIP